MILLLFQVAQQQRGPPVTNAGVAPLGPWSVFLTWDQPKGAIPGDLWAYRLKFNNFLVYLPASAPIMFYTPVEGISPGRPVNVEIIAMYTHRANSAPMTLGMTALRASQSLEYFCL